MSRNTLYGETILRVIPERCTPVDRKFKGIVERQHKRDNAFDIFLNMNRGL